jgi:DNA-3-methyladenine glycosylase
VKSPTSKGAPAPSSPSGLPPDRLRRADLPSDTHALARDLIGKLLVRRCADGVVLAGRIVETEAYGRDDPASHAFRGPTKRNASMFLAHAHLYVYFIYGTAFCANVSTETAGVGAAVLLRAAEPLLGCERMRALRGRPALRDDDLARGPGNLARAFGLDAAADGLDLDVDERVWLADDGTRPLVGASVRIGLTKAVALPHRYFARGSRALSGSRSLSPESPM